MKTMNLVGGLISVLYGGYLAYSKLDSGFTVTELAKAGGLILTGLFFALKSVYDTGVIGKLVNKIKTTKVSEIIPTVMETASTKANLFLQEDEKRDFEYITYLRNRFLEAGDAQSAELCAKLNGCIFGLHKSEYEKKIKVTNE